MNALPTALSHEDLNHELEVATALAKEAGALLLSHLAAGLTIEHKTSKDDPVTAADREASALVVGRLAAEFPEDGLLSEEEVDNAERLNRSRVWIIDPIDGTSEYAAGTPDYCVSIGLAIEGQPVLGVVYAPATGELFSGVVGYGVTKNGKPVTPYAGLPRISVSDSEFNRELKQNYALPNMLPSGSIALKLAKMAAHEAESTFTMSPRSEWDIAAGHALLKASGGDLSRRDGSHIKYNARSPHIEQGILGGYPEAVAGLKPQLLALGIPNTHLDLTPDFPAWQQLSPADQKLLVGVNSLSIRYNGQGVLALLLVNPTNKLILRAEGNAFHLQRLMSDVTRAIGQLTPQSHTTQPQ